MNEDNIIALADSYIDEFIEMFKTRPLREEVQSKVRLLALRAALLESRTTKEIMEGKG